MSIKRALRLDMPVSWRIFEVVRADAGWIFPSWTVGVGGMRMAATLKGINRPRGPSERQTVESFLVLCFKKERLS
jgi:hypothetical protein